MDALRSGLSRRPCFASVSFISFDALRSRDALYPLRPRLPRRSHDALRSLRSSLARRSHWSVWTLWPDRAVNTRRTNG